MSARKKVNGTSRKKSPAAKLAAKSAPTKAAAAKSGAAKSGVAKSGVAKSRAAALRKAPSRTASRGSSETARFVGRAPTVLLVDDFPDAREMYVEYLEFSGFATAEASNGVEAIAAALRAAPSVILMDLAMPVMDGWEATRRLKADPRTKHIPVIAVTGHALEGDAERARQAGCDGVIAKPCLPEDLVGEVRRVIAGRAQR